MVVNQYLVEDLKKLDLWNQTMLKKLKYHDGNIAAIEEIPIHLRNKYKEVFDIGPEWLIKSAAHRGKWIDQSQSLNIYYAGTSGSDIDKIYRYVWEMGLKTTYYLRTLAASQVEKSTVNTSEYGTTHNRKTTGSAAVDTPDEASASEPVASPEPARESAPVASAAAEDTAEPAPHSATPSPPTPVDSSEPVTSQGTSRITTVAYDYRPGATTSEVTPEDEVKLCRIDDPNCEACQ